MKFASSVKFEVQVQLKSFFATQVARQLMVNRGVYPICAASGADPVKLARDAGFASDSVVLLDGESKISVVA